MKRFLMLVLAVCMLSAVALPSFAQDADEDCPCGYDEEGACLPCEE